MFYNTLEVPYIKGIVVRIKILILICFLCFFKSVYGKGTDNGAFNNKNRAFV